jgi:hypothetical protein
MSDWYTKVILTVIALALLAPSAREHLAPAHVWANPKSLADVMGPPATPEQLARATTIPKAWGRLVGVNVVATDLGPDQRAYFEAADGTIRVKILVCAGPDCAQRRQ